MVAAVRTTAVLTLLAALLASAAPARGASWRRPVAGPVVRAFSYGPEPFRAGWHRGVDLAAAPGTTVRAACAGRVVTARPVAAAGGVVTLRCGPWRVTHLPLVGIAVRSGAEVTAGVRIGMVGASREHAGLHVGVRRAEDRFGYVDPMRFFRGDRRLTPPPIAAVRRGEDLGPAPRPVPAPAAASARAAHLAPAAPVPAQVAATSGTRAPASSRLADPGSSATAAADGRDRVRAAWAGSLAPWPTWAGLALLLSGAIGGGVRLRRRRGRAASSVGISQGIP
jgi:Peptidase family M23